MPSRAPHLIRHLAGLCLALLIALIAPARPAAAQDKPTTAYLYQYSDKGKEYYFIAARRDPEDPLAAVLQDGQDSGLSPFVGEERALKAVAKRLTEAAGDSAFTPPSKSQPTAEVWAKFWDANTGGSNFGKKGAGSLTVINVNKLFESSLPDSTSAKYASYFLYGNAKPTQTQIDTLPSVATDGTFYGKERPALLTALRAELSKPAIQAALGKLVPTPATPTPSSSPLPPVANAESSGLPGYWPWALAALVVLVGVAGFMFWQQHKSRPIPSYYTAKKTVDGETHDFKVKQDMQERGKPKKHREQKPNIETNIDYESELGLKKTGGDDGAQSIPERTASLIDNERLEAFEPRFVQLERSIDTLHGDVTSTQDRLATVQSLEAQWSNKSKEFDDKRKEFDDMISKMNQVIPVIQRVAEEQRAALLNGLNDLTKQINGYVQTSPPSNTEVNPEADPVTTAVSPPISKAEVKPEREPTQKETADIRGVVLEALLREAGLAAHLKENIFSPTSDLPLPDLEALGSILTRLETVSKGLAPLGLEAEASRTALGWLRSEIEGTKSEATAKKIRLRLNLDVGDDATKSDLFGSLADALLRAYETAKEPVAAFEREVQRLGRDYLAPLLYTLDEQSDPSKLAKNDGVWSELATACRLKLIVPSLGNPVDPKEQDIVGFERGDGGKTGVVRIKSRGLRWGADAVLGKPGDVVLRARIIASAL